MEALAAVLVVEVVAVLVVLEVACQEEEVPVVVGSVWLSVNIFPTFAL